jgi:hypothetical protein
MNMVDDATSATQACLGKEETIWAAVGVLRAWIGKYGVPRVLYTDWKNVHKRKATAAEQMRGKIPVTQFGRMCQKLGIGIVAASTPQAKGRVERNHGTHQDRLIKKLRRKGIDSYQAANEYLEKEYLPAHNRRFAVPAAQPEDYHGRKPSARELRAIFRLETERGISNDWVIRHEGRNLHLKPGSRRYGPTRSKALVCEWEDGTMEVYYRGEVIAFTELKKQPRKPLRRFPRAPGPWWCGKLSKTIRGGRPIRACGHGFRTGQSQRRLSLEYPLTLRPKLQGFASVGIPTRNTTTQKRGHF